MQTPTQIEFESVKASAELRTTIDQHVVELEKRFDRATVARIAVRGPGAHHQTGGQYRVSIRLALPDGPEVHVDQVADGEELTIIRNSDVIELSGVS